jgi:hypothetical protein
MFFLTKGICNKLVSQRKQWSMASSFESDGFIMNESAAIVKVDKITPIRCNIDSDEVLDPFI